MTLSQFCFFCIALLCLLQIALSQTVVDMDNCRDHGLHCGEPGKSQSQKYCCAESGRLFKCCNPYIGLIVGLCVGVPLVILIIIAVVVLYCCCARYHNKKMLALATAYRRRADNRNSDDTTQPPPYSHTDQQTDTELPSYSATDPYASVKPPSYEQHPATDTTENCSLVVPEDAPLLTEES